MYLPNTLQEMNVPSRLVLTASWFKIDPEKVEYKINYPQFQNNK